LRRRHKLGPVAWSLIGGAYVRRIEDELDVAALRASAGEPSAEPSANVQRMIDEARLKAARAMLGGRRR